MPDFGTGDAVAGASFIAGTSAILVAGWIPAAGHALNTICLTNDPYCGQGYGAAEQQKAVKDFWGAAAIAGGAAVVDIATQLLVARLREPSTLQLAPSMLKDSAGKNAPGFSLQGSF